MAALFVEGFAIFIKNGPAHVDMKDGCPRGHLPVTRENEDLITMGLCGYMKMGSLNASDVIRLVRKD